MYRGNNREKIWLNPEMIPEEISILKYLSETARLMIERSGPREGYWYRIIRGHYRRDIERLNRLMERRRYQQRL